MQASDPREHFTVMSREAVDESVICGEFIAREGILSVYEGPVKALNRKYVIVLTELVGRRTRYSQYKTLCATEDGAKAILKRLARELKASR
ncbi:hypothetical protein [Streptomyces sp. CoH17]|uniref:hypothetical protein n=1 Tax=Streptomyces sp. CoH17 TaxID=2992806 RepID=UPI00226D746B|nr:hypothetical protein [Streptomyces sp. CoH17]